jgi:hypothetical protein
MYLNVSDYFPGLSPGKEEENKKICNDIKAK